MKEKRSTHHMRFLMQQGGSEVEGAVMYYESTKPETVVDHYGHVYKLVYGQMPHAQYMGNQWYRVNGEMVHHKMMVDEIDHLRDLAQKQRIRTSNKGMVRRLIDKLRLM